MAYGFDNKCAYDLAFAASSMDLAADVIGRSLCGNAMGRFGRVTDNRQSRGSLRSWHGDATSPVVEQDARRWVLSSR